MQQAVDVSPHSVSQYHSIIVYSITVCSNTVSQYTVSQCHSIQYHSVTVYSITLSILANQRVTRKVADFTEKRKRKWFFVTGCDCINSVSTAVELFRSRQNGKNAIRVGECREK